MTNGKTLNRNDIVAIIESLAMSQGFYGRLYNSIAEMSEDDRNAWFEMLEEKGFKDDLDFILYIEG